MARWFRYATHAQVLADHPGFDWRGVVDPDPAAQAAARDDWRVPVVGDDAVTVAHEVDPEALVIATPPGRRLVALEACPNLRAAMVEKPLGGDEGRAIVDLCRRRGVALQVNYWRRGDDLYHGFAAGRLASLIGRPQAVFATYGNGLANNGSHLVDFLRMLLGEVVRVRALGAAVAVPGLPLTGDLQVPFALILADGTVCAVAPLDFGHYREVGVDVWGDGGRLALYQEGLGVLHYPVTDNRGVEGAREVASDSPDTLAPTVGTALFNLYDDLAAAATAGGPCCSGGDNALTVERILDAVRASAAAGGAEREVAAS